MYTYSVRQKISASSSYNASTGDGATATIDSNGNYRFVGPITGLSTGWTHVTGTPFGGVLFYNGSTGEGATASLDDNGIYSFVECPPWILNGVYPHCVHHRW